MGGDVLALAPADDRQIGVHPAVATVPVEGIEPVSLVLASRRAEADGLVVEARESMRSRLTRDRRHGPPAHG